MVLPVGAEDKRTLSVGGVFSAFFEKRHHVVIYLWSQWQNLC